MCRSTAALLTMLLIAALATAAAASAGNGKVLILEPTVEGGAASREAVAAEEAGEGVWGAQGGVTFDTRPLNSGFLLLRQALDGHLNRERHDDPQSTARARNSVRSALLPACFAALKVA